MTADIDSIRDQLVQFVQGSRSEAFPEDDVMHDLVIAAASYNRTGGELLHDEHAFLQIAARTLGYLDYLATSKQNTAA